MAVCWLSARTCNLLPSSFCFSWCVSSRTQLRLSAVSGANVVANGGEGSAFPFSRHSFTLLAPSLPAAGVRIVEVDFILLLFAFQLTTHIPLGTFPIKDQSVRRPTYDGHPR